jgi:ribokinase
MDLIMRVSRLPKPGESLIGTQFMTAHGGKGANQAVAAARLGANVTFVGCVGDDAFGDLQRKGFLKEGINVDHLKTSKASPTGTALILLTDSGQNAIVVAPAANHDVLPADIEGLQELFAQADMLISQLEIPLDTVMAALGIARSTNTFSILDAGPAQTVSPELLVTADLVSPNETEAEALTGIAVNSVDTARIAAQQLRGMGVKHVVMKLGEKGCLYLGEEERYVPAFVVNAVDTTAAGDAFTAALGVAWETMPLQEALQFANATGALAATIEGAQPSMPTKEVVLDFLNRQKQA